MLLLINIRFIVPFRYASQIAVVAILLYVSFIKELINYELIIVDCYNHGEMIAYDRNIYAGVLLLMLPARSSVAE